jgi:hypothetical protein
MIAKKLFLAVLGTALVTVTQWANAEQAIAEFSGSSSGNTAEFEARAPWVIDWLVSGDPGQYEVVDVALVNAITGAYEGVAIKTKTAGNGVRLFDQSGRYYFRVDASMMNWNIKVIQLTAKEAEQYKPKVEKDMLDQ